MLMLSYSRTRPLAHRRMLAALLGVSVLTAQLTLPSLDSSHWTGVWSLLTLPVIAYCLHGLTSQVWTWNRLFRPSASLDEYEIHARNAFIALAYRRANIIIWSSFASLLIGGGLLRNSPTLNVLVGANVEVAVGLFVIVLVSSLDVLPRIMAALYEPDSED